MTPEQFNYFSEKYLNKKTVMDHSFLRLLESLKNQDPDQVLNTNFNECAAKSSDFITEFELFITNISADGYYLSDLQISDVLTSIENVLEWFITLSQALEIVAKKINIPNSLIATNFFKTSQSLLKTYRKEIAKKLELKYKEHNLSIEGFMSKEKVKFKTTKYDLPSVVGGFILLFVGIFLSFTIGLKTGTQYWIARIIISLGAGFLISGFGKSYVSADFKFKGAMITSCGAVAVFLILYFFNPASSPNYTPDNITSTKSVSKSNK